MTLRSREAPSILTRLGMVRFRDGDHTSPKRRWSDISHPSLAFELVYNPAACSIGQPHRVGPADGFPWRGSMASGSRGSASLRGGGLDGKNFCLLGKISSCCLRFLLIQ